MEWEGEKIEGVDQGWKLPGRLRWGKRDNQDMNEGGGLLPTNVEKNGGTSKDQLLVEVSFKSPTC